MLFPVRKRTAFSDHAMTAITRLLALSNLSQSFGALNPRDVHFFK